MKCFFYKIVVLCSVFIFLSTSLFAGSVHLIISANTTDKNIGQGCSNDATNVKDFFIQIFNAIQCRYDDKYFLGNNCTKAKISDYISNMEVNSDDVIIFYYSGHGAHAINNSSDPYPQMCMNTSSESMYYPVSHLRKLIASKHPKLALIFTDCCNKETYGVSIKSLVSQYQISGKIIYDRAAIRSLFSLYSGDITMTSSKLGQYSYCNQDGSYFTHCLIDVLETTCKGYLPADWKLIVRMVHDRIYQLEFRNSAKQEPYYEINVRRDNE